MRDVVAPATDVRVIVIQPHTLMRQGMVGILDAASDLQVVAHTGSLEEGIRMARDYQPDVVLVDVDVPEPDGVRVVAGLKPVLEGGRVLVMAERATEAQVERALGEGADGYTVKGVSVNELLETVRKVA
jgi:DNA-binding NarL/FixJ family response regulator